MAHPDLLLSRQLCFLVYRLEKELTARYRPLLEPLGLTYPQYLVMLALWEQDGRTVGDLCRTLHLDTGTISPLLKRLEAQGLLQRRRSPGDERTVLISLSPAGAELAERAASVPRSLAACTGVSEAEYLQLHGLLSGQLARLDSPTGTAASPAAS